MRRWLNDEALTIRSPTWLERALKWKRRNRQVARVVAVAAVLLAAVTTTFGSMAWVQHQQARVREILEAETKSEVQVRALLDRASQRLRIPTFGRRREAQDILRHVAEPRQKIPAGPITERLDLEIRSVFAWTLGVPDAEVIDSTLPDPLPAVFHSVWRVALHPDGEAMVIGTHLGPVRWVRGQRIEQPPGELDPKRPLPRLTLSGKIIDPARQLDPKQPRPRVTFSPNGKYLAFAPATGGLELWDEEVIRSVAELEPRDSSPILAVGFDRQVETLWACRADGQVRSWSLPDFKPGASWQVAPKTVRETITPFNAAAFNTDGTKLAAGDKLGHVFVYESSGKLLRELPSAERAVEALAWSPDSHLVAVGTKDGIVQIFREDGSLLHRLTAFSLEVSNILFHPDGRWVLAGGRYQMKVWDLATGEQLLNGPNTPCGFARNGRRFATGGFQTVEFCSLVRAQAVKQLSGHRASVERINWSRDNRHLVSMDTNFEVRVWDVPEGMTVDLFRPPPGGHFAGNASVSLDDTGAMAGYASGGPEQAHSLVRDLRTHKAVAEWELPGGYERMTYADGKFLLVREEELHDGSRQSVAYELVAGQPLKVLQVVRPSEPGETGFFDQDLTPDGRYYLWAGPRRPPQNCRVEIREVATGRLVSRVTRPENHELQSFASGLSPDGRSFWVRAQKDDYVRYGIATETPPERVSVLPVTTSLDARWLAFQFGSNGPRAVPSLTVRPSATETDWLEFVNSDLSYPASPKFSPDGRYLAWGSQSGTITVADLETLRQQVTEFEASLRPK